MKPCLCPWKPTRALRSSKPPRRCARPSSAASCRPGPGFPRPVSCSATSGSQARRCKTPWTGLLRSRAWQLRTRTPRGLQYAVKGRGAFVRTTEAARPDRGSRLSPPARDNAEVVLALTAAKQRLTQAFTEYEQALTSHRTLIQQAQTWELDIPGQAGTRTTSSRTTKTRSRHQHSNAPRQHPRTGGQDTDQAAWLPASPFEWGHRGPRAWSLAAMCRPERQHRILPENTEQRRTTRQPAAPRGGAQRPSPAVMRISEFGQSYSSPHSLRRSTEWGASTSARHVVDRGRPQVRCQMRREIH